MSFSRAIPQPSFTLLHNNNHDCSTTSAEISHSPHSWRPRRHFADWPRISRFFNDLSKIHRHLASRTIPTISTWQTYPQCRSLSIQRLIGLRLSTTFSTASIATTQKQRRFFNNMWLNSAKIRRMMLMQTWRSSNCKYEIYLFI